MWVQPFRNEAQQVPERTQSDHRVAVLLNANARKFSSKIVHSLSHAVPDGDLYVSRSELDARRIAQAVLDKRYHTVFLGGGDGTFSSFVNEIMNQVELRRQHHPGLTVPRFGVLKLGTGNSVATLMRSSSASGGGILDDVLRARAGEIPGYRTLDLLMVEGKRAPFAGLGLDGKVLNDFIWVKQNLGKGMLTQLMNGRAGYFTSVAFKTVPYYLANTNKVECEVINGKTSAAYRIAPNGLPMGEPVEPGGVMFRGELMMAAAGTTPYYGFELKMFPFATKRRGMMNLRIGTLPTMKILTNLKGLWAGTWFPEGLLDFHCSDVTINFGRAMPFQVSGDAEGYRDSVRLQMAPEPIEVVDFTSAIN